MPVGDQSYLLTISALLRAEILADPIPAYAPRDLPIGWHRLWGRLRAR